MNGVEREFEKRDATIYDLEGQVKVEKSKFDSLEAELQKASRIIESQKGELGAARKMQRTLVEQCEHVEGESRELQEFLQIEKMALSETLKDAENEIETLKETITAKENEVKEAEERCGHLVRLGERRHQELLTSTQQLKAFSDMAKSMLISQVKLVPALSIKKHDQMGIIFENSGLQIVAKLITRNVIQNQ